MCTKKPMATYFSVPYVHLAGDTCIFEPTEPRKKPLSQRITMRENASMSRLIMLVGPSRRPQLRWSTLYSRASQSSGSTLTHSVVVALMLWLSLATLICKYRKWAAGEEPLSKSMYKMNWHVFPLACHGTCRKSLDLSISRATRSATLRMFA